MKYLSDECYLSTGHTPGLFILLTLPTTLNLVADDFGANIFGKNNANHLINTLKNTATSLFIGMLKFSVELSWDGIMIKNCRYLHAKVRQLGSCTPTPSSSNKAVNLTLSANHPAHPCTPAKGSAHAHTQNCARMHR